MAQQWTRYRGPTIQQMHDSAAQDEQCLRLIKAARRPAIALDQVPHVLLVVDQLSTVLGGGERVLLQMAGLLPQHGYRVTILALRVDPGSPALQQPLPCDLYELSVRKTFGFRALKAAFELRRFLKANRIALVQTFFESSDIWVGGVTKLTTNAKLIWSRRDMGILRSRKHEVAYRLMKLLPDLVFAVSEKVRHHCIAVDRIPADRVEVTYNGIDVSGYAQTRRYPGCEEPEIIIATLGNIRRVKGHDTLVRAAGIVARDFPNVRFLIAGQVLEDDFADELADLANQFGITERVQFVGDVQDQRRFLAGVDIFVLPSRSEGFSNAIIEAMAAGLPVIATDVGGNAEAVMDQITGYIIPQGDAEALAVAMRNLLLEPQRLQSMGCMGRKRAEECFTSAAMMKTIVSYYDRLLQTQP